MFFQHKRSFKLSSNANNPGIYTQMATLLVCTGATITFEALVKQVLKPDFVNLLIKSGVTKLVVQYGNEIRNNTHISQQLFQKTILENGLVSMLNSELEEGTNGMVSSFSRNGFELVCFPFSPNINDYIDQADVIISHAGTGSIIDSLYRNKKLIVVVNESLMDNHQEEIAREFVNSNYCLRFRYRDLLSEAFSTILHDLLNNNITLQKFPKKDGRVLETIISEELKGK
ncbi:ALG13 [Candida oxycetoniae]|uniref:UDP-N-acetylglucosamine transferase subunit ALG13 n=1 Tax=Candida oxycetoniae TaxID=497107 RepID=A0AAI9WXT1_9ASCO|nr:ALG13 [Candida oxycetoniae]KAI3404637.2 ALG13 [Candida oxycetoniae]